MPTQYVEQHEGAHRVAGSRVSLDSLVYAFWDGKSPETIAQSFPTLTLEQVYGAIAFYLGIALRLMRTCNRVGVTTKPNGKPLVTQILS
jgi:uncharacterized protein (DUF433 family)